MTNKRKQNRVLYICLIFLLVTASVLIAIASTSNRSAVKSDDGKGTVNESGGFATGQENSPPPSSGESGTDKNAGKESEKTSENKEPVQSVAVTVDSISFTSPADGQVSYEFSLTVPVYSLTMNDYRTHNGVDIATEPSSSVRACADGQVVSLGYDPMMGMSVRISHGGGVESVYRNLSEDLSAGLKVGSIVKAGDVIATVGDSALIECEEEPHLHFELEVDGEAVDPLEYVNIPLQNESYEG